MTQGQLFIHTEKIMKLDPYLKPIKQKFRLKKRWNREDKTENCLENNIENFMTSILWKIQDVESTKH